MLSRLREAGFDVLTKNHAEAILLHDFPGQLDELAAVLLDFRIGVAELISSGGGEAAFTQRLRRDLTRRGWPKHVFTVQTIVDGIEREAIGHEVDHVRSAPAGRLALEIEWNNKDAFYDRDLENFQRLHMQSALSAGIVVTRGASMQEAFSRRIKGRLEADGVADEAGLARYGIDERTQAQRRAVARMVARGIPFAEAFTRNFVTSKYGQASTHWDKLRARVDRGVGNPCPLLLIGLPAAIFTDDPLPGDAPRLPL
ncbi:BglII/BstYI family type II restriction endonuclease [Pseudoroseicyclus aestuarii]|uniref:Restriction endonuclease BglII n=1 Tax=Pseudoroseicyclus aestuarii TaxID=1795041 RepID=A0A318SQF6_9RHOB|nr:BglII/BstYI family type II restriction endonuclease [Pseudoroseicyclus aestuarii]PYE84111.1 restriction endonuclease BglII [Pseudoroseicyclus aestuarii]